MITQQRGLSRQKASHPVDILTTLLRDAMYAVPAAISQKTTTTFTHKHGTHSRDCMNMDAEVSRR
jgi:hypothetical protein